MRIPLHGNKDALVRLDHWMDAIACRKDGEGFRKPRTSKKAKARGPICPTRLERLAKEAYS